MNDSTSPDSAQEYAVCKRIDDGGPIQFESITRIEIVTGTNSTTGFILAIVQVDGAHPLRPVYVREPFEREPDVDVASVNFKPYELLKRDAPPK